MKRRKIKTEYQVYFLLGRLGAPICKGTRYLRYSLPLYLKGETQPDRAMWERIATRYDAKPSNVRVCIRSAIRRAWARKTDFWLQYFGEQESCPTVPEFYQMAADWMARHKFVSVDAGKAFDEIHIISKPVPAAPDKPV